MILSPVTKPSPNTGKQTAVGRAGTESSRRALLDAVGVILEREGLEGMSLRKVAAQAGLSHAAPGVLFGGRAAMLTAYAADGFRELGRRMDIAEREATDGRSALAGTGLAYVMFAVDEPLRFQVMFRTDRLLPRDPDYVTACQQGFIPLQRAIERGRAEGSIRADETQDVMLTAWSVVHGLANLWFSKHLAGRVRPDPEMIARRVTQLFAGVVMRPPAGGSDAAGDPAPTPEAPAPADASPPDPAPTTEAPGAPPSPESTPSPSADAD
ncbi:MAG: TetR-like C-terminal domain-containing protein [Myxococcota bacterium]